MKPILYSFPLFYILFFLSPAINRFGTDIKWYTGFAAIISLYYLVINKVITKLDILFIIFLICCLISLPINYILDDYINSVSFLRSFINLTSILVVSSALSLYYKKLNPILIATTINYNIYMLLIYSTFKYISLYTGLITPESLDFYRQYDKFPLIIRGFFNEPSHYAIAIILLITIKIFLLKQTINSKNYILYIFIIISIALTYSITAYVLISLVAILYLFEHKRKYLLYIGLLFILTLLLSLFLINFIDDNLIIARFIRILSGNDGSANYRLTATWLLFPALENIHNLLFGVGVGNMDIYSLTVLNFQQKFIGVNVFANILFSSGLAGFLSICLIFSITLKNNASTLMIFCIICFTHGYLIGPFLFPIIGIIYAIQKNHFLYRPNVI